ncbi:MAG: S26 family signal peptidase [Marinifilaceae bacterium]|nr:S26 family signal peptidase [Marinifilaceae bacterium]
MLKRVKPKAWIKFSIVTLLYLLWALWAQSWLMLILLPVIFDWYITKKVNWTFWKKRGVYRQSKTVEWIDAVIFAVIVTTIIRIFLFEAYTIPTSSMEKSMMVGDYLFVSKVAYGPKIPNTPIAMPFVHNTMPFTKSAKSYSELIKWPYKRIAGLGDVERNDIVVFNFPTGDTVIVGAENPDYYAQMRGLADYYDISLNEARNMIHERAEVISRPIDKREHYIKRCVGLPGDTLSYVGGVLYVNGQVAENPENMQYNYIVKTNGTPLNKMRLKEMGISYDDMAGNSANLYNLPLTGEMVEKLKGFTNVLSVERVVLNEPSPEVFPFDVTKYPWSTDNFGPLYIPKKGETVKLTTQNVVLYERIIDVYEGNELSIKGDVIYINGQPADSYTFKMDYYWMMGDNRHGSADSRFWGFVPEDHVVGKAWIVWFSLDKDNSFLKAVRWNRLFKGADKL